jgi:hypothetical protein
VNNLVELGALLTFEIVVFNVWSKYFVYF